MRDKIAEMIRGWNPQECYPSCCEETPCKICIEADSKADAFLALEVEGKGIRECTNPDCDPLMVTKEECRACEYFVNRNATIGDLIEEV